MKRLIFAVSFFLMGIVLNLVVACQEKPPNNQAATPQAQEATEEKNIAAQDASTDFEFVGTVERNGEDFIIITDTGDYSVASQPSVQNLDEVVGKRIKVTATLVESSGKQGGPLAIDIIKFSEIE